MNPDAKCEDCRYWKRAISADGATLENPRLYQPFAGLVFGQCRFNPPTPTPSMIGDINQFPLTNPSDWCGKFESKTQTNEITGPK